MEFSLDKWCYNKNIENQFITENKEFKTKRKISHFQEDKEECHFFKLVGVVVHSGVAESGHYYSFILNNNKWYEFNDTNVKEIQLNSSITFEEWFGVQK